jgi:hypothetical protein
VPVHPLAIDLSGPSLRVLEGTPGGLMRCGESSPPPGTLQSGRAIDPAALGQALRQLLARTEITANRAMIAASDAIASFRVASFPPGTADEEVDGWVLRQLPPPSDRMAIRRVDVRAGRGRRMVYAVAWDRAHVQSLVATVRAAGLEPAVVELKSLCVARAVPAASCIVLDMSTEPCEAVVIQDHVPRIWHSFRIAADGDLASDLATGLRPLLAFYRQSGEAASDSPILIRSEQTLATPVSTRLAGMTGHAVEPLPQPPRVSAEIRFGPFLTCLGLVMRRS